MGAFAKAETLCEAKAPRPLAAPKRIGAKRPEKVNWSDPAMVDKLAAHLCGPPLEGRREGSKAANRRVARVQRTPQHH
jgi:hypothetical protein